MTSCTCQPKPGVGGRGVLQSPMFADFSQEQKNSDQPGNWGVLSDLSKCHDRMALPISARWQEGATSELSILCQQAMWRECKMVSSSTSISRVSQLSPAPAGNVLGSANKFPSHTVQVLFKLLFFKKQKTKKTQTPVFVLFCFVLFSLGVRETSKMEFQFPIALWDLQMSAPWIFPIRHSGACFSGVDTRGCGV